MQLEEEKAWMVDKRKKEKRKKGRCWHVGYTTCTPDDVPCDYWSACSDTSIKGSRQLGFFSQLAITPRQDGRIKTRRIVVLVDSGWNSLSFRIERFLFWIFRQFVVRMIFPSLSIPFDKFGIKRGFIYYYRGEISLKMERRDFFKKIPSSSELIDSSNDPRPLSISPPFLLHRA